MIKGISGGQKKRLTTGRHMLLLFISNNELVFLVYITAPIIYIGIFAAVDNRAWAIARFKSFLW